MSTFIVSGAAGIASLVQEICQFDPVEAGENLAADLLEVLKERTLQRAYYLHLNEQITTHVPPGVEIADWCWTIAELVEKQLLLQEIRHRAYFLWRDECHRTWDTEIHKNDWYHWFLAERETVNSFKGRLEVMANSIDIERQAAAIAAEVSDCAYEGKQITSAGAVGNHGCCVPHRIDGIAKENGASQMNEGKEAPVGGEDHAKDQPKPAKTRYIASDKPFGVNMGDRSIDYSQDEYVDKLVVTDAGESEVLAVVGSIEQLERVVQEPSFRARLQSFGRDADFVVHHGRSSRSL